jgi:hypothetical protein
VYQIEAYVYLIVPSGSPGIEWRKPIKTQISWALKKLEAIKQRIGRRCSKINEYIGAKMYTFYAVSLNELLL